MLATYLRNLRNSQRFNFGSLQQFFAPQSSISNQNFLCWRRFLTLLLDNSLMEHFLQIFGPDDVPVPRHAWARDRKSRSLCLK